MKQLVWRCKRCGCLNESRVWLEDKDFHSEPVKPYFWGHGELKAEGKCISCGHLIIVDQELHDLVLANRKP